MDSNENSISRRGMIATTASIGAIVLADSLLSGCKSRSFNKQSSGVKSDFYRDTFMNHYDRILRTPEAYADPFIPGFDAAATGVDIRDAKIQFLLKFLILIRIKTAPTALFDELKQAGKIIINPAHDAGVFGKPIEKFPQLLAPVLVLSHASVVGSILNPKNTTTNPMLVPFDLTKVAKDREVDSYRLFPYQPEMPLLLGHYILCDDDVLRHDGEKGFVTKGIMKREDADTIQASVAAHADALVKAALARSGNGTIDIVRDLARWLPVKVVTDYFGVPSGDKAPAFKFETAEEAALFGKAVGDEFRPSETQMYVWIGNGFRNMFLNLGKDPVLTAAGRRSGAQLIWYIYRLVKAEVAKGAGATNTDTVLGRFVAAHLAEKASGTVTSGSLFETEDPIAKYPDGKPNPIAGVLSGPEYRIAVQLTGSVAGAGVTVEEAIARVFNVLFDPKNAKSAAEAIAFAKAGDRAQLRAYAFEAMRFQPQAELIPRVAVNKADLDGTTIPAGALVFASIYSAMHDNAINQKGPMDQFIPGREASAYLHFGWGRHTCLGVHIAPVEIVEAMLAVFKAAPTGQVTMTQTLQFSSEAPYADGDIPIKADGSGPYAHSLIVKLA